MGIGPYNGIILIDKLEFDYCSIESGGPNSASMPAGLTGPNCQRRLTAKLEFDILRGIKGFLRILPLLS